MGSLGQYIRQCKLTIRVALARCQRIAGRSRQCDRRTGQGGALLIGHLSGHSDLGNLHLGNQLEGDRSVVLSYGESLGLRCLILLRQRFVQQHFTNIALSGLCAGQGNAGTDGSGPVLSVPIDGKTVGYRLSIWIQNFGSQGVSLSLDADVFKLDVVVLGILFRGASLVAVDDQIRGIITEGAVIDIHIDTINCGRAQRAAFVKCRGTDTDDIVRDLNSLQRPAAIKQTSGDGGDRVGKGDLL